MTLQLHERLGARYDRCLVPVAADPGWLRDAASGALVPVQAAPRLATDPAGAGDLHLALVDLAPGQHLDLAPAAGGTAAAPTVTTTADGLVIRNGRFAVRVPADGQLESPFPGPIDGLDWGAGFTGGSQLTDVPYRGAVTTVVESLGPALVQWRTEYRWGNSSGLTVRVRWAAGSDTLAIVEEAPEDTAAAVVWQPFGGVPAQALARGGGEGRGPMHPLAVPHAPDARRGAGRRRLGCLSHIAYFNQWNLAWAGFVPAENTGEDAPFLGIFSGWGECWQRRGAVRPEVWEDDATGAFLRLPVRAGRRCYGLVLGDAASAVGAADRRCLPNRRKTVVSDLRLDKVLGWELDPPLADRRPHLVDPADLAACRARLAGDPQITAALDGILAASHEANRGRLAAAWWKQDAALLATRVRELVASTGAALRDVADGGYERLIIFDGRIGKAVAYDLDVLWAEGLIDEADYRAVRRWLLALAYMFADPGYCRYDDFPTSRGDDPTVATAMRDEMGDAPVPPNFAAEFHSTTGVVAEAFPDHPCHAAWRAFAIREMDAFLTDFFEADGSYHESINYQAHIFNEMLCLLYPHWRLGVRDWFAEPRVVGAFRHLVEIQLPPVSDALYPIDNARSYHGIWADAASPRRTLLPANGNSSGDGCEMPVGDLVTVGAAVYRQRDPALSAALMGLWRRGGKPVFSGDHPLLSLLLLDPARPDAPPPTASAWRRSQFIVSRAATADGAPLWALFRAGSSTHHMCFDQGHLHLAAWDSVLLGDYGYHAHDSDGKGLPAAATWLHNTLVYSDDRDQSSGYTGLECAPEPALVHLGADIDWCVHRIVNSNHRRFGRLPYFEQLIVPTTRHVRHYLCVKSAGYILLWDVFEEAHAPSTFWLHPLHPVTDLGGGAFRAGTPGRPHLAIRFALPAAPQVVENRQLGNLWSFALRNPVGAPWLCVLRPQRDDEPLSVAWDAAARCCRVNGRGFAHRIRLPAPGDATALPEIDAQAS